MRSLTGPPHSTPKLGSWQASGCVAVFLLALSVVYFRHQLLGGRALYWGDIGLYFTPMQLFLKQNEAAGRLPLWNPLIFCGTPYLGSPQVWPLYPVSALLPFMPVTQFLSVTVALHVWLAGLGAYGFARRALGVRRGAALLAAVTFMFGGQLVSKEQFPNMVQAASWLPWVLLCLDALLRRRRLRDALALGLVLGLQLLAAHAQMTVLTLYLAAAYGVFVWPPRPNPGGDLAPALSLKRSGSHEAAGEVSAPAPPGLGRGGLLLLSVAVASGLAMGQILPTLALFRDAARQRLSFAVVDRFYLPPNQLGNFVLPRLHGQPFFGDWSARGNFWETCCYVGGLPLALALWGGWAAWRRGGSRAARFWTGVFLFGVWMALGGHGGAYFAAYWVLPGFKSFHDPARCLLWACFALSLLAASGWDVLLSSALFSPGTRGRGASLLLVLLAFADLAHFGRTLYPLADPAALFPMAPNVALVQGDPDVRAHQARILAPTAGVWLRFSNPRDYRQNAPGYETLWADTLTPNLMMPYGLSDAFGYEPVALKNAQAAGVRAARSFEANAPGAAAAGALGVKYVAVCRVVPPSSPGLATVRAAPTLAPPGRQHGARAQIYLSRDLDWQPRAHLEGSRSPVALSDEGPDRVVLDFRTATPARLLLEDTRAAGWRAALDGRPVPIEASGASLRAVAVPQAGQHRVVFTYAPTPFRLGLYLSLLTLAGLAAAASGGLARKFAAR